MADNNENEKAEYNRKNDESDHDEHAGDHETETAPPTTTGDAARREKTRSVLEEAAASVEARATSGAPPPTTTTTTTTTPAPPPEQKITLGDSTRREKVRTLLEESAAVVVARTTTTTSAPSNIPPPPNRLPQERPPHIIECGGGGHETRPEGAAPHTTTMGDATRREKTRTLLEESAAAVVARTAAIVGPPKTPPRDIECGDPNSGGYKAPQPIQNTMGNSSRREKVRTLLEESAAAVVVARTAGRAAERPPSIIEHGNPSSGDGDGYEASDLARNTIGNSSRREKVRTLLEESAAAVEARTLAARVELPERPPSPPPPPRSSIEWDGPSDGYHEPETFLHTMGNSSRREKVLALLEAAAASVAARATASEAVAAEALVAPEAATNDLLPETGNMVAVAMEVREHGDDDSPSFPEAVEFDPEAKPPIFNNTARRFLCVILGGIVLLAIVMFVFLFKPHRGGSKDDIETNSPTSSPTAFREGLGIQEYLQEFLLETVPSEDNDVEQGNLWEPNTPPSRALDWILHDDPAELDTTNLNLPQRFLLALFFFSTGGSLVGDDTPSFWTYCSPSPNYTMEESFCYKNRLYDGEVVEKIPSVRWLSAHHECRWTGIVCDEFDRTRGIDLVGQNLTGSLPLELGLFPFLNVINFFYNKLTGTIPKQIGSLKLLIRLELAYNDLSGAIPNSLWELPNLEQAFWQGNLFTGTVPSRVSQLRVLRQLAIGDNIFTGTIPTEIGTLHDSKIGNLVYCEVLYIDSQELEGLIPSEIGTMSRLRDFRAYSNSLEGEVPQELWKLTGLGTIDLYNTKLSGTIVTEVGLLDNLRRFRVSGSRFYGTIPTEFGLLTGLLAVRLQGTSFTGTIPDELCELRGPYTLGELTADCAPSESTGESAHACQTGCCTTCCERDTGECFGDNANS